MQQHQQQHTQQNQQNLEVLEPFFPDKVKSTAWLIRCSNEQKEFFQKLASESGKNAADFISGALENYKIKSTLGENSKAHKEINEAEFLIERLTSLIRSKILILSEQEIQLNSQLEETNKERQFLHTEFAKNEEELKNEFHEKSQKQEADFLQKTLDMEAKRQHELKIFEDEKEKFSRKIDHLQESLFKKSQEIQVFQKQVSDSMKISESLQERNSELKISLDKLENENNQLKQNLEKQSTFEKDILDLNHKIEIINITHAQEIKRLNSEHELKIMIKEQEVENRHRTS